MQVCVVSVPESDFSGYIWYEKTDPEQQKKVEAEEQKFLVGTIRAPGSESVSQFAVGLLKAMDVDLEEKILAKQREITVIETNYNEVNSKIEEEKKNDTLNFTEIISDKEKEERLDAQLKELESSNCSVEEKKSQRPSLLKQLLEVQKHKNEHLEKRESSMKALVALQKRSSLLLEEKKSMLEEEQKLQSKRIQIVGHSLLCRPTSKSRAGEDKQTSQAFGPMALMSFQPLKLSSLPPS